MAQHGQVRTLRARRADGKPMWAYRYRVTAAVEAAASWSATRRRAGMIMAFSARRGLGSTLDGAFGTRGYGAWSFLLSLNRFHGHTPSISTSREKLSRIRIRTMIPSTVTLWNV